MPAAHRIPPVVWYPRPDAATTSQLGRFTEWLRHHRGVAASTYDELWRWSVTDIRGFWSALAEFTGVRFHHPAEQVLDGDEMPGARWFPGATLNYAEHVLTAGLCAGKDDAQVAVVALTEDGRREQLSHRQLRADVAAMRAALVELGVGPGERVVGLCPNAVAAVVTFLAAASLGAVWSACSAESGVAAVVDRFAPLRPAVLLTAGEYASGGQRRSIAGTVAAVVAALPDLRGVVTVDDAATAALAGAAPVVAGYHDLVAAHRGAPLTFDPVGFSAPLWVLYSSGTTGPPKGIVHGHGGILLEHLKVHALHADLCDGERFFWFTDTGWMVWNYLVSGLVVGATIVLYEGSATWPELGTLWSIAEREAVTYLGVSATYLHLCVSEGLRPRDAYDLSTLRTVASTGAPLAASGFAWVRHAVSDTAQPISVSGGTDLCSGFLNAAPTVPVWEGEISCRSLGTPAVALDPAGDELVDEVGELVLTAPMPSMPVSFWDDPDGRRLREAYYEPYPGRWRHGDWVRITGRGTCVLTGRSDATLNRAGIRMGTSELYAVVEALPEIVEAIVVDTSGAAADPLADDEEGELLCFVVLAPGAELGAAAKAVRAALARQLSPRHVPDRVIPIEAVPRTLNGKKCEVPVKRILAGVAAEVAVRAAALRNPDSLRAFVEMAAQRSALR